jgi:adenine C2-methylase RlmN of 23S rRNA A2503 and tRNA A37
MVSYPWTSPEPERPPRDITLKALYRIFVVLEEIRDSIALIMPTHHEQAVEALLRQLIEQIKISNDRLAMLINIEYELESDVDEIEDEVEKLVPRAAAVSATLVLIPNT